MITDNFCFYLQNRLIQTSQTGGQRYCDTSPFSIPWWRVQNPTLTSRESKRVKSYSINGLFVTFSINGTEGNNTLLLCWMSLWLVSCFIYCYGECHYAECRNAECRGAGFEPTNLRSRVGGSTTALQLCGSIFYHLLVEPQTLQILNSLFLLPFDTIPQKKL